MAVTQSTLDALTTAAQGGTAATGTITFNNVPTENDTITVNGVVFTFKADPADDDEIDIAGTAADQATAVADFLNGYDDADVNLANYSASGAVVTVTYIQPGTVGNAFTLAKSGTDIAVSDTNLAGGVNTGGNDYDPKDVTGGGVETDRADSDFENSVLALIAAVEFVVTSSENPVTDSSVAKQQRVVLRNVLNRLSLLVPTAANSASDDRSTLAVRLRKAAIALYNNMPRSSSL